MHSGFKRDIDKSWDRRVLKPVVHTNTSTVCKCRYSGIWATDITGCIAQYMIGYNTQV